MLSEICFIAFAVSSTFIHCVASCSLTVRILSFISSTASVVEDTSTESVLPELFKLSFTPKIPTVSVLNCEVIVLNESAKSPISSLLLFLTRPVKSPFAIF